MNRFVWEAAIGEPVELVVEAHSGDVAIRRGAGGKVKVQGTIHLRAFPSSRAKRLLELIRGSPPVEVLGREVRVGDLGKYADELGPSPFGWGFGAVTIDYEIEVPERTEARVETGSGDVEVSGIAGPLRVSTGSGDVKLEGIGGEAEVRTGSGDVIAERIGGDLSVTTGSGDVGVREVRGDTEIRTGSGDIRATEVDGDLTITTGSGDLGLNEVGGDIEVRTGSGDIAVDSVLGDGKTWRLRTGSGDVRLALPSEARFRLEAETDFGEVHSDFPSSPEAAAAVEVKTGGGDIEIRSR